MNKTATTQLFLYSDKYDFEYYPHKPSRIMAMLFVPRSGSTLLACLLQQTSVVGFPLEYFADINVAYLKQRFSDTSKSYIEKLFSLRTTKNGYFSYKLSADILQKAKELLVPKPDYVIIVDRDDKLAQAKSYTKARLTQEWVIQGGATSKHPSMQVNEAQVLQSMKILQSQRDDINMFASTLGSKIFRCSFEDIIKNPQKTVDGFIENCDIKEKILVDINKVPISKQSN